MTSVKTRLRILCLHGYRQNDVLFREKTGGLRKQLKKYADFEFINAPLLANVASEEREDVRSWWFSREDGQFCSRDVCSIATGFEKSVSIGFVEYSIGIWFKFVFLKFVLLIKNFL